MTGKQWLVVASLDWQYEAGGQHIGLFQSMEGAKSACEAHFKEREIEDTLRWTPYYQREGAPSQNEETQGINGATYTVFWDEVEP